jgi:hypothetical protein
MGNERLSSEDDLLRQAVAVLQARYERGSGFVDLSPTAVTELSNKLEAVAVAEHDPQKTDRAEAIALAHRLVDDDSPELSPMWPRS